VRGHIPVAATPHYRTAAPISGNVSAANVEFGFEMKVTRVNEARVSPGRSLTTRGSVSMRLGEKVDADLAAGMSA
jgi:hypothetical protein